ncbi:MAG TPA: DNA alkylation repair protein, partial [Actinomycetota bacterium]|nr:DNA alkylation repair protein [Actinomycetota bacterium]
MRNERNRAGMARFGVNIERALGISMGDLRRIGRELPRDHRLALELWSSGVHEARILASIVDDPDRVTIRQMEEWTRGFDSWDLVDQCCINLFSRTPHAVRMAERWAHRRAEFVKRTS